MKALFEYLLSKNKKPVDVVRPTEGCSIDDIIKWIESYGIKKYKVNALKPGEVAYDVIRYDYAKDPRYKKHSYVKLVSCLSDDKMQSVIIYPYGDETKYRIGPEKKFITFEEAIILMEDIMVNPKTKL